MRGPHSEIPISKVILEKYMKEKIKGIEILLFILICGTPATNTLAQLSTVFVYDFKHSLHSWVGGFADYPVGGDHLHELGWGWKTLPDSVHDGAGFYISSNNHSDDMFMYLKTEIMGLQSNTHYRIKFEINFATSAPYGCAGIGGSPGESVFVNNNDHYTMNIDKGNQESEGRDAIVIGNVANSLECNSANPTYEMKSLDNSDQPFSVRSDEKGSVWLIIGTDSGFEGTTTLYYDEIKVIFTESDS
jgi:hypothetical protein